MTSTGNRLALYLPSLRGGGAERVMVILANALAKRGYGVDLVLAKAEGPYLKEVGGGVRVVDLESSRVLTSLPGLVRYLRKEHPQALLSAMGHANVIAVAARKLACVSTRVVVSERSHFSESRAHAQERRARVVGTFMSWAYPRAEGVVAISAGVADDLAAQIGLPRPRIRVVFNPILDHRLRKLAAESIDPRLCKSGEGPLVLAAGRLAEPKGFSTLIRAFARLRAERPARLVILGEGPLRKPLEAEVQRLGLTNHVSLPGFADNPFPLMRQADLFVLSSRWEGFGNVLVEAMACGTPVVSTNCPSGPAEILENGRWGRLVPVGDDQALAEAMAATLDEAEHPDVMSRAAQFSVDRAVDGYLHLMVPEGFQCAEKRKQTKKKDFCKCL